MAISKPFAYNPSTSFSIGSGFNALVSSVGFQSDGKIMVGGDFSTFTGSSQNRLVRLNTDGSKDETFDIGSGFNGPVYATEFQSDGKVLVGGDFTTFTGSTQNRLVRLNSDGSKDTSFDIGSGFGTSYGVFAITIQSDGKILVGGNFSTYKDSTQNSLIRLNSDGSKDTSFDIGSGFIYFGSAADINSISIQNDGKIIVGGSFTQFTGSTQNRLVRLNTDGSKDSTFNIGSGFDSYVSSIAIQSNGKILVGGGFTTFTGSTQNNLIRLNSNGSKDETFNIGSGFDSEINSVAVQSDGKILAGGYFTTFTGSTQNKLIRLNSDGSKDTSFNIGSGFTGSIYNNTIKIQSDGKILAGGTFTEYSGSSQNRLIKLNSDGSIFSGGAAPAISGTTQYGDLVVGNIQTEYSLNYGGIKWWGGPNEELGYVIGNARPGGQPVPAGVTGGPAYVGFWRSPLLTDNSFLSLANYIGAQNSEPPFATTSDAVTWLNDNGYYTSFALPQAAYYIGGSFTEFNGSSENKVAMRLNSDGSRDTTYITSGITVSGNGYVITNYLSGTTLVGGQLSNGATITCIVSLDSQGNINNSFNVGTGFDSGFFGDELVSTIVVDSNNKVLVGGFFSKYNGQNQNSIIRLNSDGSKDTSFNNYFPTTNSSNFQTIEAIVIDSNNKILVGGSFTTFSGSSQNYLIRLNSDGTKDTSFNIGSGFNGPVSSFAIQSDGKILVGGNFATFTGSTQNNLIRLNTDGSKDSTFNIESGFNGGITSIAIQSDGKILVGGAFTTYQDSTQNNLIRLNSDGSKDSTFDIGSGFDFGIRNGCVKIDSNAKILVGGFFTTFNGSSQNYLIRLNSDGTKDTSFNIGSGPNSFVGAIKII